MRRRCSVAVFFTLQPTAIFLHCNTLQRFGVCLAGGWGAFCVVQHTAIHCNTLQHTATHCNTLQHTATHCNALVQVALEDEALLTSCKGRLKIECVPPELNPEMDTFRSGSMLELVRELALRVAVVGNKRVKVCVCVYVYVYNGVCVYTYVHMCDYRYMCVNIHLYLCIFICIFIYLHQYIGINVYIDKHICICIYRYIYV